MKTRHVRPLVMGLSIVLLASLVMLIADQANAARLGARRAMVAAAAGPGCCVDPCCGTITQTLQVCHPCTGCTICVDVCTPACCNDVPKVCSRRTLVGCGLVRYDWCCGYSVVLRFTRCGDVRVIYRG